MTRLATPIALAAIAAALLAGCGSSSNSGTSTGGSGSTTESHSGSGATNPAGASVRTCDSYAADVEELHVNGVACRGARKVMLAWQRAEGCGLIGSASRGSCAVGTYRCLSTRTDRAVAVTCSAPGRSIFFFVKRG